MKKFTTLVLAAAALLTASAQAYDAAAAEAINQKINNGFVADASVLDEAQKFLDSAQPKSDSEKMTVIALRSILNFQRVQGKLTWDEQKAFVDNEIAQAKLGGKPVTSQYLRALYIWWNRSFDQEIYAFMKTLPDYQKWYDAGHVCAMLEKWEESYNLYLTADILERAIEVAGAKLHDPQRAFEAAKLLLSGAYNNSVRVSKTVRNLTQYVIGQPGVPEEEVKAFLVNLNRKCSVNMVKDRASWEPVVTEIRTLLATY